MSFELVIKEEAHQDAIDAYNYYEEKLVGLGERFLQELEKRYNDLIQHPTHYSYINEDERLIFREILIHHFPYVVVFEIIENTVFVFAIHNTYKNPAHKIKK